MTRGLQAGLLLAVVVGAGLRVLNLGTESLWVDEAYSIQAATKPLGQIAVETAEDVHPPFYYWVLHFWIGLAGSSEAGARLLSAVISTLTILALYQLASRLFDPPSGVIAAALMAVSPFHLGVAQEARMYALLALLSVLSMDGFVRLLDGGERRRVVLTLSYVAATVLALYTHVYGFLILLAQMTWLGVALFTAPPGRAPMWKPIVAAQAASLALFLPWVPVFFHQLTAVQGRFWLPPADIRELAVTFVYHAGAPLVALIVLPLAIVGLARRDSGARTGFLGVWILCLLIVPFALSQMGTAIFGIKYAIAASPALLILAARGMLAVPAVVQVAALLLFVWLTHGTLFRDYTVLDKDDWRGVAARIEAHALSGDLVLFHQPYGQIPFDYYTRRSDLVETRFLKTRGNLSAADVRAALATTVGSSARIWLVLSTADAVTPLIVRELQSTHAVAEHHHDQGIETYLFVSRTEKTSGVVLRNR